MDKSDWLVKSGTMCTFRATGGSIGRSSSASWVDFMVVPFGLRIVSGFLVGILFLTGRSMVQNVPVVLLSTMSVLSMVGWPGGIV